MTDRWLMLIHQIPPKPDYFRVKVRRRLQRLGAMALKNSVYVLPRSEESLEDFAWLVREIEAEGGEATLCGAELLSGTTDEEIETMFRTARAAEFAAIINDARRISLSGQAAGDEADRLRRRLDEAKRLDYFEADGRTEAERAVAAASTPGPEPAPALAPGTGVRGATWVTRTGIKVDRIASAWLIRRFIDPEARFRFVSPDGYQPATGELRFDMYQGEFTHEGERCTFETLLTRFALADPALHELAEIVHDVDCKDDKFGRAEAAGIASVISGLAAAFPEDQTRLERGAPIFEGLYAYISGRTPSRPSQ